jgi:hypothetical protein
MSQDRKINDSLFLKSGRLGFRLSAAIGDRADFEMQLTKKQRLITGPKVEGLLELLEDPQLSPERAQTLISEILRLQLNEFLRGHAESADAESDAPLAAVSAATRVCDLIDSKLATLFKGWIFRHLAAEVGTQDVLASTLAQLAEVVVVARSQPIGAVMS